MIELTSVSKSFGRLRALDEVNLHCVLGECYALVGANACGKTTLIKTILGMVMPDKGQIRFNGKDISGNWQYRGDIGYMPQVGRYPDNMTIGQVLHIIRDLRKGESIVTDEELVETFGIAGMMHKRMRTLSGGTRQKVSACIAFLFNANVLILDEPTAGLDPVSAELLKMKIQAEKARGKLILITTHILSELDELVDKIVYMEEGKIRFLKTTEELRSETGEEKLSKALAKIMS